MKIINAYFKGLKRTLSSFKMITVIYFITLVLAMMIAFPFRSALKNVVGHSLLPEKLLHDFNFTIYKDLMHNYGDSIIPFIQVIFWVGVVYLFFTIFFSGGILNIFHYEKNRFSMQAFFEGAGKFFLRFFRLIVFTFLLNIIFAVVIYFPLSIILSSYFETVPEKSIFFIALFGIAIHLLLIIFSLIISDYAKIKIVVEDTNKVFKTFWRSIKFTFKHLVGTYLLYLLLLLFPIVIVLTYYFIEKPINMDSAKIILTMFFIQQIFIWLRIFSKVWFLRSELYFYKNFIEPKQLEDKKTWDLKDLINPDEILDSDLIA